MFAPTDDSSRPAKRRLAPRRLAAAALLALLWTPPAAAAAEPRGGAEPAVDEVDILRLSPRMARFLIRHVSPRKAPNDRVDDLMDAIFGRKGLGITYEGTATLTAAETFEARQGNCLSFTILFVAMARHLGLDAYFLEVDEVISWDRRGEVVVRNQHMIVEVEVENGRRRLDFLPEAEKRYRAVKRISDRRALAHYHNNLGVEALAAGDVEAALAHLGRATSTDATFSHAWTNLGVAQRHGGAAAAAEASYLQALELDSEPAALANLASLYLATGRASEAAPLRRKIEDHLKRNPFHHFRLGTASVRSGVVAPALRHFREAVRRLPGEPEFHAGLADALARLGEVEKARRSYQKALELAEDESDKERFRQRLAGLSADR